MTETLQQENERLKKELSFYQKKFSLAEHDVAIDGYISYCDLVRQQVEYVRSFKIKDNIDGKKAETVLYDRSIALWESLPEMLTKMSKLKVELGIEYNPEDGKKKEQAFKPELAF